MRFTEKIMELVLPGLIVTIQSRVHALIRSRSLLRLTAERLDHRLFEAEKCRRHIENFRSEGRK
jgi:hypothetical protein